MLQDQNIQYPEISHLKSSNDGILKSNQCRPNREYHLLLSHQSTPWVHDLLIELEKHFNLVDSPVNSDSLNENQSLLDNHTSSLSIDLKFSKKENTRWGDFYLFWGSIECHYIASCIRCLIDSNQEISIPFQSCLLNGHLAKKSEFLDQDTVYLSDQEWNIDFFSKGNINIKELINEALILEAPTFPLHKRDCRGLCLTCGNNLNIINCEHH